MLKKLAILLVVLLGLTGGAIPAHAVGDCGPMVHSDAVICLIGSAAGLGGGGTGLRGNPSIMMLPLR